jgi:hypothetical protein
MPRGSYHYCRATVKAHRSNGSGLDRHAPAHSRLRLPTSLLGYPLHSNEVRRERPGKGPILAHTKRAEQRPGGPIIGVLRALILAVPYKVHTVLTDNGIHFTDPTGGSWNPVEIKDLIERKHPFRAHAFELACARCDIDHRLTKPKHPWTNGQVERMNRTIKEATVKRFYYETHDQLRSHLADFVAA